MERCDKIGKKTQGEEKTVRLLILNGPNLNRLGKREPEVYGTKSLVDIESDILKLATEHNVDIDFFQSNSEGDLIDKIHELADSGGDGIVFNPGAFSHYSIALRDAVASVDVPVVEIHISNIHSRETFRHTSIIAPVCIGQVTGLGVFGYELAFRYFLSQRKGD